MYKKIIFIAIVLFTVNACKKTIDPGTTKAAKVANEWWVNYYLNGEAQNSSFSKIETYNVAANNDSIWVDDLGNIWDFKIRASFDPTNLSFNATNAISTNYLTADSTFITVTITDAKIIPLAAKSTTGVVTDSIYFKVSFSDDKPVGTIYEVKGTGRTRWSPDDY